MCPRLIFFIYLEYLSYQLLEGSEEHVGLLLGDTESWKQAHGRYTGTTSEDMLLEEEALAEF